MERNWGTEITDPLQGRKDKPRNVGLTMVLDKGLGFNYLNDLLEMSGEYIDFIKFSFGTSFVYPREIVKEKINLIKEKGIKVFPGGTLLEVALEQNKINEYLFTAKKLGFNVIEISNGSISYKEKLRKKIIRKAKDLELEVLTEVGKKDQNEALTITEMSEQLTKDLANGAEKVIIEARESGKNISIYQEDGSINISKFEKLYNKLKKWKNKIIWEAPLKKQQVFLIQKLGPNVNLGNISSNEVIALETLRRGLRGDTFKIKSEEREEGTYLIS